jgi:hypothetical protein
MSIAAMPRRRARPVPGKGLISHPTAKLGQTEALAGRHRPARPDSVHCCFAWKGALFDLALASRALRKR